MPTIKDALDIIGKLTVAEQESLKTMLLSPAFVKSLNIEDFVAKERFANGRVCPLCGCIHVVRNGHRKDGTQRYVCKDCGKSFVIATNSIVSGTRKDLSVWEQYIDCMMNGLSIRKTAVACGIHRNTAFLWRHKILDALQNMADDVTLDGIIEADETFFAISYKGNHSKSKTFAMPRKAHKRGHSTHIRGLSQEKVCVPCAVNRNGLSISKITNTGRVSTRDLHHIYDGRIKTNSTLVTDKMNSYTCTRCGDSYTDNYTNPLGHNYEAAYYPATCTDYGKTVFTCQVCGSGYYETDGTYPTGHNYNNEIITAPTCTADGLRRSTCESCGHTFDAKITANGHNYNITESISVNGKTTRTYTCTTCGHSYKQELGDQYEEVTNYVEYLFEQYEPYMWWVLLASAGVWSIVIGVMIAIAHKNEEKEKAKKMLINYVIGLVVIAVIVVACPFLIRGIAALVT